MINKIRNHLIRATSLDIDRCPIMFSIYSNFITIYIVILMNSTIRTVSFLRVGKRRLEIFHRACSKFNLVVLEQPTADCCSILIDDELDYLSASKIIQNFKLSTTPILIRTQWLSDSIKQNQLLSHQSYIVHAVPIHSKEEKVTSAANKVVEQSQLKRERSVSSSNSDTDDERNPKKV